MRSRSSSTRAVSTVVDAVGHETARVEVAEHDLPVARRLQLGRGAEVGDHPVTEAGLVQLDQHARRQIPDEPDGRRVDAALPDQPGGERVRRASPRPGSQQRLADQVAQLEVRCRVPEQDAHRELVVQLADDGQLPRGPGVHRGHPQTSEGEVGGPGLEVVDHPGPGVLGRRLDHQPGVGEQTGGVGEVLGQVVDAVGGGGDLQGVHGDVSFLLVHIGVGGRVVVPDQEVGVGGLGVDDQAGLVDLFEGAAAGLGGEPGGDHEDGVHDRDHPEHPGEAVRREQGDRGERHDRAAHVADPVDDRGAEGADPGRVELRGPGGQGRVGQHAEELEGGTEDQDECGLIGEEREREGGQTAQDPGGADDHLAADSLGQDRGGAGTEQRSGVHDHGVEQALGDRVAALDQQRRHQEVQGHLGAEGHPGDDADRDGAGQHHPLEHGLGARPHLVGRDICLGEVRGGVGRRGQGVRDQDVQ